MPDGKPWQEDYDPASREIILRKYFSGGIRASSPAMKLAHLVQVVSKISPAMQENFMQNEDVTINTRIEEARIFSSPIKKEGLLRSIWEQKRRRVLDIMNTPLREKLKNVLETQYRKAKLLTFFSKHRDPSYDGSPKHQILGVKKKPHGLVGPMIMFSVLALLLSFGAYPSVTLAQSEQQAEIFPTKKYVLQLPSAKAEKNRLDFSAGVRAEAALGMFHGPRHRGGNEASIGDFYVNAVGKIERKVSPNRRLGMAIDWVPEDSVLDFNDSDKQNYHNGNRLRLDGFVNRPNLLANIYYRRDTEKHHVTFGVGGREFAGLDPIEGSPTAYYAARLSALELSKHYDKGIFFEYDYGKALAIDLGLIDGDWEIGQPSVFRNSDSRANSYPGYTGRLDIDLFSLFPDSVKKKIGRLDLEGSVIQNDIGSNGGQKTYLNHWLLALGYTTPRFSGMEFEIRGFSGKLERGPTWGPEGQTHWTPELTSVMGVEAALRDIPLGKAGLLDLYAALSQMKRESGEPAGLIWIAPDTTYENQWQAGLRWKHPFGGNAFTVNLSVGERDMDGLSHWNIHEEGYGYTYLLSVGWDVPILGGGDNSGHQDRTFTGYHPAE